MGEHRNTGRGVTLLLAEKVRQFTCYWRTIHVMLGLQSRDHAKKRNENTGKRLEGNILLPPEGQTKAQYGVWRRQSPIQKGFHHHSCQTHIYCFTTFLCCGGCAYIWVLITFLQLLGRWLQVTFFFSSSLRRNVVCTFCTCARSFGYSQKIPRLKKRWKKGESSDLTFFETQKVETFFLTFFGPFTCLWIPVVCGISLSLKSRR